MPTGDCERDDCTKPKYCKGLCTLHYQQMRRGYAGPPVSGIPYEVRFWALANKAGPVPSYRPDLGPCWIWTGSTLRGGYGKFGKPTKLAHRIAYELMVGPIPYKFEIDHLCRVRNCVNPHHLEAVTKSDNQRRGYTVSGFNAVKTHCDSDHEFNAVNTRYEKGGRRRCRECDRAKARRARLRKKLNAA